MGSTATRKELVFSDVYENTIDKRERIQESKYRDGITQVNIIASDSQQFGSTQQSQQFGSSQQQEEGKTQDPLTE